MKETFNTDFLVSKALDLGFEDGSTISFSQLTEKVSAYSNINPSIDSDRILNCVRQIIPTCEKGCFLVCALPYAVGTKDPDLPPSPFKGNSPFMHIAPFAARHYYKAAVEKMKIVQKQFQNHFEIKKDDFRIFCNSKIPEKWLAKAAGIGEFGKNNLIIHEKFGTRFVIVVLFIKKELPPSPIRQIVVDPCKNCEKCMNACPVNALSIDKGLDIALCLQAKATKHEQWDEELKEIWGRRLYGCEICQHVCPHNQGIQRKSEVFSGYLGEKISIEAFLRGTEEEIKAQLKGSALGMSWIPVQALLRNALVAAGNTGVGTEELKQIVSSYTTHPDKIVQNVASWAIKKIL